jgi:hypothetical protein
MHDLPKRSTIIIMNAAAKTSSVVPVINTVLEVMRLNAGVCTSLTELLVGV